MNIIVDHRETGQYKHPYDFASVQSPVVPFTVTVAHLATGDYATGRVSCNCDDDVEHPDEAIIVERKTLVDLYTSLGNNRIREERKFTRMRPYSYAALVIEADWQVIMNPNSVLEWPSKLNPKSVIATLLSWSQRYGVHVFACPNRNFAEQLTYRMLERWTRDRLAKTSKERRNGSKKA